jgi:hypothetical protein
MPILHQYHDKSGWYVRTVIDKAIITFQLTSAGARRLLEAGGKNGRRFRRATLFELFRSGDAFTHGTGPGVIEAQEKGQIELDFTNDPEPESIFPRCSLCGSLADLHLVELCQEIAGSAAIYCPQCRKRNAMRIDTSMPIRFVNRGVLEKFLEYKGIVLLDASVTAFSESLAKAFKEKWDKFAETKIQRKKATQTALFEKDERQKKLI